MFFAFLLLTGAAFVGIGFFRRLCWTGWLNRAEQFFGGWLAGWMLSTLLAYGLSFLLRRISFTAMLLLIVLFWSVAVFLWLPELKRWREDGFSFNWQPLEIALGLLLTAFGTLYGYFFSIRMFPLRPDGMYSGGNSWNDMSLHLAISSSFLYGENFPPIYTPFAFEPMRYPFLPDFQTAVLMSFGLNPWAAMMMTAVPLALLITGLLFCLAHRLTSSLAAATLTTLLFFFNGGLGFIYFLEDWRKSREPFWQFVGHLQEGYANWWGRNLHWANIIVDTMLPQRTSLYGLPAALFVFLSFALFWQRIHETPSEDEPVSKWSGWPMMLVAGAITGLLPYFHPHSYLAVGLISGFLFLLRPHRTWLLFWIPAVALALPQIAGNVGHASGGKFFYLQPGWKMHDEKNFLLYLLRNIGLPLLLLIPAWKAAQKPWRSFYAAFVLLMCFCLIVMVTPHDYDNIKLMYYWYAISCILIGAWLVRLATIHRQYVLTGALLLGSIASGLLSLQRERLIHWRSFTNEEIAAAEFVRENTSPHALFLTAPIHNQPILCLAGRPLMMAYESWLWTHGYQVSHRAADIKSIYSGAPNALELVQRYGIKYIYVSWPEKGQFKPNLTFLNANFTRLWQSAEITIYATDDH